MPRLERLAPVDAHLVRIVLDGLDAGSNCRTARAMFGRCGGGVEEFSARGFAPCELGAMASRMILEKGPGWAVCPHEGVSGSELGFAQPGGARGV